MLMNGEQIRVTIKENAFFNYYLLTKLHECLKSVTLAQNEVKLNYTLGVFINKRY